MFVVIVPKQSKSGTSRVRDFWYLKGKDSLKMVKITE